MAAVQSAALTLAKHLKKTGNICPQSLEQLRHSVWTDNDFAIILGAVKSRPNQTLAALLFQKAAGIKDIENSGLFRGLLMLGSDYSHMTGPLMEKWGIQLVEAGKFGQLGALMAKVRHWQSAGLYQKLDEQLLKKPVIATSTELALLFRNMVRAKYPFSTESQENVLKAAIKLWFQPNPLCQLVYYISKSSLSFITMGVYLSALANHVEAKCTGFTGEEKAYVLTAYSLVWVDSSRKILESIMNDVSIPSLRGEDINNVMIALSRMPIQGDTAVFEEVEKHVLSSLDTENMDLPLILHCFTKRGLGSPLFFKHFKHTFGKKQQPASVRAILIGVSLLKHPGIYNESGFKQRLETILAKFCEEERMAESAKKVFLKWGDEASAREVEGLGKANIATLEQ